MGGGSFVMEGVPARPASSLVACDPTIRKDYAMASWSTTDWFADGRVYDVLS
jgi:hypothetical protein